VNIGLNERDRDVVLSGECTRLGLGGRREIDRQNVEALPRQPDTIPASPSATARAFPVRGKSGRQRTRNSFGSLPNL